MRRLFAVLALLCLAAVTARTQDGYPSNYVAATLVQLNDNGAWSWFMDPRVIVNDGTPQTTGGTTSCFAVSGAGTVSGRSRRSRATRPSTICAR